MTERDGDKCFNPRPRVGGDDCVQREEAVYHVSIHAPAWGATGGYNLYGCCTRVSIHAPAWGATSKGAGHCRRSVSVSIHAPAWGATAEPHAERLRGGNHEFQSTPPRGGRRACRAAPAIHAPAWGATTTGRFQSTPPRGGRPMTL